MIDQLVGDDRGATLDRALAVAADRGDAQVVVVCAPDDAELEAVLSQRGFTPVVDVMGR